MPGGNLGNSSAFGKAFFELEQLGLIDQIPRLAVINAAGSNTLYQIYEQHKCIGTRGGTDTSAIDDFYSADGCRRPAGGDAGDRHRDQSAGESGKCLRALEVCDGVVREVSDQEIMDGKAQVGAGGFGCEPASGASIAGAKRLREEGVIAADDRVVCILTGHGLKDPNATVGYHSGEGGLRGRAICQSADRRRE